MIESNPSGAIRAIKMALVWVFALVASLRNEIVQQLTYNQSLVHLKLLN